MWEGALDSLSEARKGVGALLFLCWAAAGIDIRGVGRAVSQGHPCNFCHNRRPQFLFKFMKAVNLKKGNQYLTLGP